jgi:hypothetical protein
MNDTVKRPFNCECRFDVTIVSRMILPKSFVVIPALGPNVFLMW